jgi:hypothetical protein
MLLDATEELRNQMVTTQIEARGVRGKAAVVAEKDGHYALSR